MAINEDAISQALDRACNNPSLYFQVTAQEPYLSIFINREAESELDYNALAKTIQETITPFSLPAEIQYLALYSRVYGVSNTDWETSIELERQVEASLPLAPTPEEPREAIESPTVEAVGQASSPSHKETPSSLDKETLSSLDLSQYCFIRNHSLLTASIIPPPAEVARVVLFFHNLPDSEKEQVLPALEPALKKAKVQEDNNFSSEVNQWLEEIAGFNPEQSRKASIWFSRYCNNLEGTISELTAVLEPPAPEPESPASESNPPSRPQQEETINLEKPVNRVDPSYSTSGEPTPRTRPQGGKKRAVQPKWLPIAAITLVFVIWTTLSIGVLTVIEKSDDFRIFISLIIDVGCSAIALYLVSMVGWIGIGVNSLKTLWTVAAIWGTFETIISIIFGSLPSLGILAIFSMLVRLIAFWIISLLVKGLKLDLTGGYPTFLFSVGCFHTIRVLLKMAIFYLIFILFFS